MFHKVKSVEAVKEYVLSITFENGEMKTYDIAPLFDKWHDFGLLATAKGLFEQVKIEPGGYAISWNDDLDLSSEELYLNGCSE